MDKISLPECSLEEYSLEEIRFRSLVTLKLSLPISSLLCSKFLLNLEMSVFIIGMLLEDRSIEKKEVCARCYDFISIDHFDEKQFNIFFQKLKNYCGKIGEKEQIESQKKEKGI